ncbi:MAG: hypothetical protein CVV51_10740 [Spirochaetae bacterium HGW-Spirochaetae-7]|nr:MAG: hypothetical protein CVV51_10740 [Spirochaetae bacterium HGW-Spirochaetae-7]
MSSLNRGTSEAWVFAQVDDFWLRYRPLSPWGKDEGEARTVLTQRSAIEARYDDIDAALLWLRGNVDRPEKLDLVSYHLKRMPRLPQGERDGYELLELFQVKKFIANYRGLATALGENCASAFGFVPLASDIAARRLAVELDRGGSDPETFHLADCYDDGLSAVRAGIATADRAIALERARAEAEARLAFGVSFDGREFIVVPAAAARAMIASKGGAASSGGAPQTDGIGCGETGPRFAVEPYDDARFMVRLMPSATAIDAMADRERGLEGEREAEARVLVRLSALVRGAMPWLSAAVKAVARWDRARAGAVLALELGMCRPRLGASVTKLREASFIPCADECGRLGLSYTPLTAEFGGGATVLFGSNMGGKTVVLKTVLFFQLLAQAGMFVPARLFETRVYGRVEYVGELGSERHAGLSGFGLEVWRLEKVRASGGTSGGTMVAFDELARTTGSHEAEALLSAVVEAYASGQGDRAFFATHFRGVARMPGVEYRRMKGLDREAARASLLTFPPAGIAATGGGEGSLPARLAGINMNMRYEVVDDDGSGSESDALAIAAFLGLDRRIVERARAYLEKEGR